MNFKIVLLTVLLIPTLSLCMEKDAVQDLRYCTYLSNPLNFPITIKARNAESSHCLKIKSKYNVDENQLPDWEQKKYFTVLPEKSCVTIPFTPVYCSLAYKESVYKYELQPSHKKHIYPQFDIYQKLDGSLEPIRRREFGFSEPSYDHQDVELHPMQIKK